MKDLNYNHNVLILSVLGGGKPYSTICVSLLKLCSILSSAVITSLQTAQNLIHDRKTHHQHTSSLADILPSLVRIAPLCPFPTFGHRPAVSFCATLSAPRHEIFCNTMKYLFTTLFLTLSLTAFADEPKDSVLICTGSASTTYHTNPDCKGLESCTKEVIVVATNDIKSKRRFCKRCQYDMDRPRVYGNTLQVPVGNKGKKDDEGEKV